VNREASRMSLLGQLLNRTAPSAPPAGMPVLLMAGDKVVARAVTNEFGEFTMDYRPRKNLRLCVPMQTEEARIEVSLEGFR
jgi:hypothetical protein